MAKLLQASTLTRSSTKQVHGYVVFISRETAEKLERIWEKCGDKDVPIQELMAAIVKEYAYDNDPLAEDKSDVGIPR
jgi:hypothetical protein